MDPAGESASPYSYAANNPASLFDPMGRVTYGWEAERKAEMELGFFNAAHSASLANPALWEGKLDQFMQFEMLGADVSFLSYTQYTELLINRQWGINDANYHSLNQLIAAEDARMNQEFYAHYNEMALTYQRPSLASSLDILPVATLNSPFKYSFSYEQMTYFRALASGESTDQGGLNDPVEMAQWMYTVINRSAQTGESIEDVITHPNQFNGINDAKAKDILSGAYEGKRIDATWTAMFGVLTGNIPNFVGSSRFAGSEEDYMGNKWVPARKYFEDNKAGSPDSKLPHPDFFLLHIHRSYFTDDHGWGLY